MKITKSIPTFVKISGSLLITVVLVQTISTLVFSAQFASGSFCGRNYKLITKSNLQKAVDECLDQKVSLKLESDPEGFNKELTYRELGVNFDTGKLSKKKTGFGAATVLVPFGGYIFGDKSIDSWFSTIDKPKIDEVVKDVSTKVYIEPKNAYINKTSDSVSLHKESIGRELQKEAIEPTVFNSLDNNEDTVLLEVSDVSPKIRQSTLKRVKDDMEKIAKKKYVFEKDSKQVVLEDPTTVLEMIDIDNTLGKYSINRDKVAAWLNEAVAPRYYVPSVNTIVDVVDNVEVSRSTGQDGSVVNVNSLADKFIASTSNIENPEIRVQIDSSTVKSKVIRRESYSKSNTGLVLLLDSIKQRYGDVSISVTGNGMQGQIGGNESKVAASTYKLLIAHAVAKRLTNNELSWTDLAVDGLNVEQCMEAMLVRSDEKCPQYWLRTYFGIDFMNSAAASLGMTSTSYGDWALSSTNDQLLVMKAISGSQGISAESAQKILGYMSSQVYRQGIEAGADGLHVAGKVGFILGYKNETAVVYGPSGPIYLSIYTNGRSWSDVATISRDVLNLVK
ncbi:serine hydrolase [Candidatus Saccharibacteria bacterium]|nr:serine hydrolase [Candidatus Saccharibacteria bacterium]